REVVGLEVREAQAVSGDELVEQGVLGADRRGNLIHCVDVVGRAGEQAGKDQRGRAAYVDAGGRGDTVTELAEELEDGIRIGGVRHTSLQRMKTRLSELRCRTDLVSFRANVG